MKGRSNDTQSFTASNTIAVKTTGVQKNWKLLLRGLSVTSVINGAAEALQEGTAVQPKEKNGMSSFISKRSDQDAETVRIIILGAMCTILSAAGFDPPQPAAAKARLMNMSIPFKIPVSLYKKSQRLAFTADP
ncbi:hypothetical protein PO124_21370 [Bacillus licheniformis]|nr:hypothetical protein [Bacillus licheniformis]